MGRAGLWCLLLGFACNGDPVAGADADGDGVNSNEDCDDENASVNPDADEVCDGLDNDCNGAVDDQAGDLYYPDNDDDGFGEEEEGVWSCDPIAGKVTVAGDCNDGDEGIHPGADEVCDQADNNCNNHTDEEPIDGIVYYSDVDGDGHGDGEQVSCDPPQNAVFIGDDCDDLESNRYPGAPELCDGEDNDCDADVDEDGVDSWFLDTDGDGFGTPLDQVHSCVSPGPGYVEDGGDCDDANDEIHPDAQEVCDGFDNDCDDLTDANAVDAPTWFLDSDGDQSGNPAISVTQCEAPPDHVLNGGDCNDADDAIHPLASEVCGDSLDNDCSGTADGSDSADAETWHPDLDQDGFGDSDSPVVACDGPADWIADGSDCDDSNDLVHPGVSEYCDDVDWDCDGSATVGAIDVTTFYADGDGDGFGATPVLACEAPEEHVATSGDCDDTDPLAYPGALESCDTADRDCDGQAYNNPADILTWYRDHDADGYGDPFVELQSCLNPGGYVSNAEDCGDNDADLNPETIWYQDLDEDNWGVEDEVLQLCEPPDPLWARALGDCDDAAAQQNPDTIWFIDSDGDNYGDPLLSSVGCEAPPDSVLVAEDCDDADADVHPGVDEYCDVTDWNCDGNPYADSVDALTWYADTDGDAYGDLGNSLQDCFQPSDYVSDATDCLDSDIDVNPTSVWFADADEDGYGAGTGVGPQCIPPSPAGWVPRGGDCEDGDSQRNPGMQEVCFDALGVAYDGDDDDCNGQVDAVDAQCPILQCGMIDQNTVWTASPRGYYVGCDVVVEGASGPELTIGPGVQVAFAENARILVGDQLPGGVLLDGTSGTVLLKEYVQGQGWAGLEVGALGTLLGLGFEVDDATIGVWVKVGGEASIEDAQFVGVDAGVLVEGTADVAAVEVQDCLEGVTVWEGGTLSLVDSFVQDALVGVRVEGDLTSFEGNEMVNAATAIAIDSDQLSRLTLGNLLNGPAVVVGTDRPNANTTFHAIGFPFDVYGSIHVHGADPVLTLEDGVVIHMDEGQQIWVGGPSTGGEFAVLGTTAGVEVSGQPGVQSYGLRLEGVGTSEITGLSMTRGNLVISVADDLLIDRLQLLDPSQPLTISTVGSGPAVLLSDSLVDGAGLSLEGGQFTVSDSEILNADGVGIRLTSGQLELSTVQIDGVAFVDSVDAGYGVWGLGTSVFSAWNDVVIARTEAEAVRVDRLPTAYGIGNLVLDTPVRVDEAPVETSGTLPAISTAYHLWDGLVIEGSANPVLTVANTELAFTQGSRLQVGVGATGGLSATNVAFRPVSSSWGGIAFGGLATVRAITNSDGYAGGDAQSGAIFVAAGAPAPTLSGNFIHDSWLTAYGIFCADGCPPSYLTSNTFAGNVGGDMN